MPLNELLNDNAPKYKCQRGVMDDQSRRMV